MSFEKIGRYKPGQNVSVRPDGELAADQLKAGRFVTVTGYGADRCYLAGHCSAGDAHPFGVTQRESADPSKEDATSVDLLVEVMKGGIPWVEAGEAIDTSEGTVDIAVGADGKAVNADAAVAASVSIGVVAENNALTFTANEAGTDGNSLSVTLVDPGAKEKALSVDVDGDNITVNLETDAENKLASSGNEVIAAIAEHDTASQLITATNKGASTGEGNMKAAAKTSLAGGTESTGGTAAVGKALTSAEKAGEYVQIDPYF